MSQRPPGSCRLFGSPQGCRFGNKCKFSHERGGATHQRASSASSQASSSRPRPAAPPQAARSANLPRGVCDFYWTTGSCVRSFDCKFRHERQPQSGASARKESDPVPEEEDAVPDFFSPEGLAANAGSVREEQHSMNPSEVHNHLKAFLFDNYRFDNASRMQGFVRILASVNDSNKAWNTGNAQAFLETVVTGNAIHRIGDVLRYTPVDTRLGNGYDTLSFQRAYFPVFKFFASDLVLKSTLHKNINHLYAIIASNHDSVFAVIDRCLASMMQERSWKDPMGPSSLDGVTVFRTLCTVFLQYFNRFKDAVRNHTTVVPIIENFARWFDQWVEDVSANPPRFVDPITAVSDAARRLTVSLIGGEIDRLTEIVARESGTVQRLRKTAARSRVTPQQRSQARIGQLAQTYEPPGELRTGGPRHNNDFQDIEDIRIAPTHEELLSPVGPYLPVILPEAPHHLPVGSMQRHLDIQFRLLREELISTTRSSLVAVHNDLLTIWQHPRQQKTLTKLEELLFSKGGAYRSSGFNSVFFQLYTNVEFHTVEAQKRAITVGLLLDAPAGAPRDKDKKKRYEYWEHSKRLSGGNLVTLLVVSARRLRVHLGVITSFSKDIAESSKAHPTRVELRVSFFDPEVELMALRGERLSPAAGDEDARRTVPAAFALLVDNGVMLESVRPFLEKLRSTEPTEIPFAELIAATGSLKDTPLQLPRYARAPGFKFKLDCLARKGLHIGDLDLARPGALRVARDQLKALSVLDESQAEAVADTLSRAVSLIQGPPGTGKSYTAKEILRVLFASKIKPIVLIAYTNHALDHMVTSVLDANITNHIVRLGSRSSDERIAQYTLDKLEKLSGEAGLDRPMKRQYAKMKKLEESMMGVMRAIQLPLLSWSEVENHLDIHFPELADSIRGPPYWIQMLAERMWGAEDEDGEGGFTKVEGKQKKTVDDTVSRTFYGFWRECQDLLFIQPRAAPAPVSGKKGKKAKNVAPALVGGHPPEVWYFFDSIGFANMVPPLPATNRPLGTLYNSDNIWAMSAQERQRLAANWEQSIRQMAYDSQLDQYKQLRIEYNEACKDYDDMRDEERRRLLGRTDLIACTTTGAAKLTSLLGSIRPKVLMVEEAGQVLEAHILTSLVTTVDHLICIGDPKQLRPNLATFGLSMDSEAGMELYKFDRSLMERLADAEYPMSQINVQRRMRPEISHFIRTILYPKLTDNDIVKKYPSVQGMQKDVFFFNHTHKEGGAEDSVSKYNDFEVQMIRDLVVYFLRQGTYSGPGDIAVLCAYLGQLQKVRKALQDLKIAVAVDERDAEQLQRQGLEENIEFEEVLVAKHIRLGTVDIFQGQEAKIVIVSLVRNTGNFDTGSASIGFLKSPNRINVALSRAKHGLYILGNAANLRRNGTWSTILDEMEARDQIGGAIPIACPRHPDQQSMISEPGQLALVSPAGGCLLPCTARLQCGHICPSACHAAPDNHRSTRCLEPCNRTPCPRSHPCTRRCFEDCGDCNFPIYDVTLPCGHTAKKVPCYLMENLNLVQCLAKVTKTLPTCEHKADMACDRDPATYKCTETCFGTLQCCTKICKARCGDCQVLSTDPDARPAGKIARSRHTPHPCERLLYCQHKCGLNCHDKEVECNTTCQQQCRQQCMHHQCPSPCSKPCAPCMEPCPWSCSHHSCPVLCGSICSRLPCDEPCQQVLACGHPCPSVCGEPCEMQKCVSCMPPGDKVDIVDFIMQRRLEEIDLTSTDVSDRLITLNCGHIFTVETLDGHCKMGDYYDIDPLGQFMSMKAPPVNYQSPPVCPTCRGPIDALRYGRVTKRATLDILEQNVASSMSAALNDLTPLLTELTASLAQAQEDAKKLTADSGGASKDDTEPMSSPASGPLPSDMLHRQAMQTVHGLSQDEARGWNAIVKKYIQAYRQAVAVANTRGAHVKAYEAARATLFRLEMEEIAIDPARASHAPEPLALLIVGHKVGQPPPKADVRFQVEAYFLSFELRSLLAQIATSRIDGLSTATTEPETVAHRRRWVAFVDALYKSCVTDAEKAQEIANKSSASRQANRAATFGLRFEFERFRFGILREREELFRNAGLTDGEKDRLANRVKRHKTVLLTSLDRIQREYLRARPSRDIADLKAEREWLNENCRKKLDTCFKEYDKLEEFMLKGAFYTPMTLQERAEIVKAFGFSHRGHFYNCENGHTFVITECGGAMEQARCPECSAPIGGGGHRLVASNTRALEFENIARDQGSMDPAFPWTRGA